MMTARGPIETFGLDPAEKLLDDVAWLGAAARASGSGFPAREFKARSAKMYDALLRPIEAALKKAGVRKLYIAPDEVLYQLPFEALAASDQGESYSELDYVGLRWTVQYVHSGTLLAVRRSRPGTSEGPVVVFGDPDYGSVKGADQRGGGPEKVPEDLKAYFKSEGERGGWSRLPFSREEAVEIAKLFGAEPKLGAKASEREVRAIRGARLLHFACHGTIDGSEPMRSALVLTADGEFDGYLEAREIAEMRVPCELAVLSACDSASGAVLRGEGLIGLTRAFLYAGARSVAASLWSVSDEGGKEFMIAFYKKLAAGQGKGEALAETKREFMRHAKYSAPYYWAGFVLYGE
jgi:CHAT domain-containing protein